MRVREVLDAKGSGVVMIPSKSTIADAIEKLAVERIGTLLLTDEEGALAGILSERDVIRVIALHGDAALGKQIDDVLTYSSSSIVITCTAETTVDEARQIMAARGIRHLPVIEDDTLVGIISIRDILQFEERNPATDEDGGDETGSADKAA